MSASSPSVLRADLHVHSCHSLRAGNFRFLKSRDCYSRPEDVYRAAKARGMDLVTITDHDSIDGCLAFLDQHPAATDFFVSEEVSCRLPESGVEVHFGVYGMTEALHAAIQPLRGNAWEVAAALNAAGVFFCLNHLLHFYRGQLPFADYLRLLDVVPALETRNGTMLPSHNGLVAALTERSGRRLAAVGGSDAHALRRVGTTWTAAPGADAAGFLASLAAGRSEVGGLHGHAWAVARDAYVVIGSYVASLLGFGPRDHAPLHRAGCLLFAFVSAPAQFLPYAIALAGKRAEQREVRRALEALGEGVGAGGPALGAAEAELQA